MVVAPDAPFLQPGWHSPLLNTKIDLQPLLDSVTQLPGGSAADEGSLDEKKRARVVVLEFWASWCPPCRDSLPHITAIRKQFSPDELTIVAVNNDHFRTYRPPDREPKRISDYVAQERKAGRVAFLVAIDENDSFKPLFDALERAAVPTSIVVVDSVLRYVGSPVAPEFQEIIARSVEETSA